MNNYQFLLSSISSSIEETKNDVLKSLIPCINELAQYSNSIARESLYETATIIKDTLGDVLSIRQLVAASIQNACNEALKPLCEALIQLNNDLTLNNREQLEIMHDTLLSFESSLSKITIHSDYVEFPSELVSDEFSFTDDIFFPADEEPSKVSKSDSECKVQRASISEAIVFICTLIQTLITIISFLQAQLDTSHEQLIELQKQQISLQKEENELILRNNQLLQEQIDATYEQTKYLASLLEQIQDITEDSYEYLESIPENDSTLPNTDSKLQDVDLCNELVAPEHSTALDQSDNSELLSEPEPQK